MALRVGFIGLGDMGKPMAANLAPAGFETTVFDLADAPMKELAGTGAALAASPAEVGKSCDLLCICVPADAHVIDVLVGSEGALDQMAPGSVVAIHSTVLPETIQDMAAKAEAQGCSLIDACVTGGASAAEAGDLVFLVGGEEAAVEHARPALDASGKAILHAGPLGSGARLKLAVNALTYINFAAADESYSLAKESGLDPEIFLEAVRGNGQLSAMQDRYLAVKKVPDEYVESDGFQHNMRLQLATAEKDLAHALELARKSGLSMPTAGLVAQGMARTYSVIDKGRR